MFTKRFLRSPRGKHFNSLERNIWRKVGSTSKKMILERNQRFFAAFLSQVDSDNVDMEEVQVFVDITTKYVLKYTD